MLIEKLFVPLPPNYKICIMDIKGVVKAHGTTLTKVAEKMNITKGRLSQIINLPLKICVP